jgi:hypothetical protein
VGKGQFLKGRVVRAVGVQLERPDRRRGPTEERLLICTDPGLPATEIITGYAKRWSVKPLFAAIKHQWGLKDAWQRSRQVLMCWVTLVAAGYALSQILPDPARLPGLADPAPWRPRATQTAGLIQAGFARILHAVGLPALIAAIPRKLPDLRRFDRDFVIAHLPQCLATHCTGWLFCRLQESSSTSKRGH